MCGLSCPPSFTKFYLGLPNYPRKEPNWFVLLLNNVHFLIEMNKNLLLSEWLGPRLF